MSDVRSPKLRIDLNKGYTPSGFAERVFHLHIVRASDNNGDCAGDKAGDNKGDSDEVIFRDWLIAHPEDRKQYEALKRKLAKEYKYDRDAYTGSKTEFISAVMAKAKVQTEK